MRKLIVCNLVSLDGRYVAGPDWPFEIMDEAFDGYNAERLRAADTLLLGRVSYDGFREFWPSVADDPNPSGRPPTGRSHGATTPSTRSSSPTASPRSRRTRGGRPPASSAARTRTDGSPSSDANLAETS
jgi:hypothetical protein